MISHHKEQNIIFINFIPNEVVHFQGGKKKIPITPFQGVKKNNPLSTHSIT
jgi:hypothetical protein